MNAKIVVLFVIFAVIASETNAIRLCQIPGEIYYHNRGPPCTVTCQNRVPAENCYLTIQPPGCYCKPSLFRDEVGGLCLPLRLCPAA